MSWYYLFLFSKCKRQQFPVSSFLMNKKTIFLWNFYCLHSAVTSIDLFKTTLYLSLSYSENCSGTSGIFFFVFHFIFSFYLYYFFVFGLFEKPCDDHLMVFHSSFSKQYKNKYNCDISKNKKGQKINIKQRERTYNIHKIKDKCTNISYER